MASNVLATGLLGAGAYQFTIYMNQKNEYYFVFHNTMGNTEPICWSEGYSSRQACETAAMKVKNGASSAPIK